MRFRKMHGIGNDFVMVDCLRSSAPVGSPEELARAMCDRRFGVGADGLIYMEQGAGGALFRMRMWNPDGSIAEMCGNGIRCMARYLIDEGIVGAEGARSQEQGTDGIKIPIDTGAGLLVVKDAGDGRIRVDMGPAYLTRGEIGMAGPPHEKFIGQPVDALGVTYSGTAVSMGNPHLVLVPRPESQSSGRESGLAGIDLKRVGPVLEHHELFPNRVNVHFIEVVDRGHLVQRTWERGAGITFACGTGACACAVAAFVNGLADRVVEIDLPGGRLTIEYAENGHVFMTGPAETVFEGEWEG